jgi:hypothetical protein
LCVELIAKKSAKELVVTRAEVVYVEAIAIAITYLQRCPNELIYGSFIDCTEAKLTAAKFIAFWLHGVSTKYAV